ncbi:MAG: RHS repeat-associated core domain-containing protein [Opitutales bacterium]
MLDRVTLKATRLPDGSVHSVGYAYTPAGQKAAVRYFRRAADQVDPTLVSETTHEYDALGRLLRIAVDGEPKVLYQYDPASLRLAARHFASGQRLAYSYDRMGRTTLLRVTDAAGDLVERVSYSWSPDGRLAERVREGRAVSRQLGADPPDQIRLVSGLTPAQAQDTPVRLIQHYHYDPLGRLAAVTYPGLPHLDEAYTYDASGNLLEKAIGDETQAFTYDLANQLKSRRDADGILTRYRYDQAGRMTTELVDNQPVATYAYGYRDRVLELVRHELGKAGQVEGGSAVRFHYDGAGMIVGKQRGSLPAPGPQIARAGFGFSRDKQPGAVDYAESAIEAWVWEDAFGAGGAPRGAQALLARGEATWANAPHVSGGVPVVGSALADEDETVFVSDFLGNTLLTLPGEAATTVARGKRATAGFSYLTTALGSDLTPSIEPAKSRPAHAGNTERSKVGTRFTGKPYDEDLQAHVFPYRNYSSDLGRWTSADPLGFPDGPNRHFYAPVPTMGLDALGLYTIVETINPSGFILDEDQWWLGEINQHIGSRPGPPSHYSQRRHKREHSGPGAWHETGDLITGQLGESLSVSFSGSTTNTSSYSFNVAASAGGGSLSWAYGGSASGSVGLGSAATQQAPESHQWWQANLVIGQIDIFSQRREKDHIDDDWDPWEDSVTHHTEQLFDGAIGIRWYLLEN